MLRVLTTLLSTVLTAGAFWLGGYDFNERGFVAVWAFFTCLFVGAMIFTYPGWDD